MAHKATLPHSPIFHAHPLSDAEKRLWRRFLIGLAVLVIAVVVVFAAPMLVSTAVAMGVFSGWDAPIDYD